MIWIISYFNKTLCSVLSLIEGNFNVYFFIFFMIINWGKIECETSKWLKILEVYVISSIQYQSKILRQKVKKLRLKVKKIETNFSFKNIKNYKLIWNSVSFIFNALCKSTWKWFNHIWYCFIINFIVCIFNFCNQFWFFINLFLHQLRLY